MSANSDKYQRAMDGFTAVIDQVPADRWSAPSPCADWTAKHVVGHVIGNYQRVARQPTGDFNDPASAAGDDPAASYTTARDAALAALNEDNLTKNIESPMGEIPLDQMMGMFMVPDVLIHTWDLAKATGIDVTLDPGLVKETYDALVPIDAMVRAPGVFGPKVEPPAGADMQTTLMCFVGRQP